MTILITGGTGFIGSFLVDRLIEHGHACVLAVRRKAESYPARGGVRYVEYAELTGIEGIDAVINLAGESVAGWWTEAKKRRIHESRVDITRRLVDWMAALPVRPQAFLSASAIGIYGDRPGEVLTETSALDPGRCFRFRVCQAWEEEANRAPGLGVRTVTLRIGNVLDPRGGAVGALLPYLGWLPFLMPFGPKAVTPWISRADAVRMMEFALGSPEISGPLNVTGPQPLTWRDIVRHLGRLIHRPAFGTVPDAVVRLVFGEFAHAFLDSQDVRPAKALAGGFQFVDTVPFEIANGPSSTPPSR